jgi:hypothetical protein
MKAFSEVSFRYYRYTIGKKFQKNLIYPMNKRSCVILPFSENSFPSRFFPLLFSGGVGVVSLSYIIICERRFKE